MLAGMSCAPYTCMAQPHACISSAGTAARQKRSRSTVTLKRRATHLLLGIFVAASLVACGKTVSGTIDDSTITTPVRTALLNEPNLSATEIKVDTNQHVVTLSGRVKSDGDRQRAITVARQAQGVADVRSELQVGP
jgi:BON domain